MFFSGLLFGLFYGICIYALCCNKGNKIISSLYSRQIVVHIAMFIAVLVVFMAFVNYWIYQNQFIYYWDSAGYWTTSVQIAHNISHASIFDIGKSLYQSINYDDYNTFLPMLIALPFSKLGYEFTSYVKLCCVMFLIPSAIIQGLTVVKMISNKKICAGWIFVIAVVLSLCFPNNLYSAFQGFIDVAYLVPMSASMYLFVDYDFGRISLSRNIAIALTLILTWICRRYTIFFLIGYVCALLIKAGFAYYYNRRAKMLKTIIINFFQIGGISLAILIIVFPHFFFRALLTNYGEMYSAYDAPLIDKLRSLCAPFGLVTVVVLIIAFLGIRRQSQFINYWALLGLAVSETFVFWKTQNMAVQHRMILNLPVILMCLMVLEWWNNDSDNCFRLHRVVSRYSKQIMYIGIVMMLSNFIFAFSPKLSFKMSGIVMAQRYYPLKRYDIPQLQMLTDKLNQLTYGTNDGIYVAASGSVLNYDILRKMDMPNSPNAIPNLYNTSDVDLRDGFSADFLHAKYIVTTDPVQTHLATGQEVVTYLAQEVMNEKSYIGQHYKCIDQIELDNHVIAKIYEKISYLSEEDIEQLKAYYSNLYPGYDSLFSGRINVVAQ